MILPLETHNRPRYVLLAGEPLGVPALDALVNANLPPALVVCNPDAPAGRGQRRKAPRVKERAHAYGIPVLQPPPPIATHTALHDALGTAELAVVVAYNHIIPASLLTLPTHGFINLHPSLLPKLRGPSPIRTAILEDTPNYVGNTVIQLDEKLDHGPILAQKPFTPDTWPPYGRALDHALATAGGALLTEVLARYPENPPTPTPQMHTEATYTKKFQKADGELPLNPFALPTGRAAYDMLCRIRAFDGTSGSFFFYHGTRIRVIRAHLAADTLVITRIVPEGKKEMDFSAYFSH